jgi:hypothetical protein
MKRVLLFIALSAAACDRQPEGRATAPAPAAPDTIVAREAPSSKRPAVLPMPKDQAQLDRMILAGYTPHGDHLHPPGVKECPLSQGSEAVM